MARLSYQNGLLFIRAYKLVRSRVYGVLEPYGLNPSYWSVLGTLMAAPDGIRLSAVASSMDVKPPLVTMLSNELIDLGLINRVPHHTDKRAKLLILTAKGKKLTAEIEMRLTHEINRLMQGMTEAEAHTFTKSLQTIITNAS